MDQDATWYGGRPRPWPHVLDGKPVPPRKGAQQPPLFGPCLLWPNGWMDLDTTWYGGRPRPDIVLDGDPAPPTEIGTVAATFQPMSVVAKRSPISATDC